MAGWEDPPRALPVQLRPVAGETVVSFTSRLAAANHLPRPGTVLHAVGRSHPGGLPREAITHRDVSLNNLAVARLEVIAGIPVERMRWALPALNLAPDRRLPGDIPAWRLSQRRRLRRPCERCQPPVTGTVMVDAGHLEAGRFAGRPAGFPYICADHRRWIDTDPGLPDQLDLKDAPEVVDAHARYAVLLRSDPDWINIHMIRADGAVRHWARYGHATKPQLHARWVARAAALHQAHDPKMDYWFGLGRASAVLLFPEIVALAELMCDLAWRRHVVKARSAWELGYFYEQVAETLGQPAERRRRLARVLSRARPGLGDLPTDPLDDWVRALRRRYYLTRVWAEQDGRRPSKLTQRPLRRWNDSPGGGQP